MFELRMGWSTLTCLFVKTNPRRFLLSRSKLQRVCKGLISLHKPFPLGVGVGGRDFAVTRGGNWTPCELPQIKWPSHSAEENVSTTAPNYLATKTHFTSSLLSPSSHLSIFLKILFSLKSPEPQVCLEHFTAHEQWNYCSFPSLASTSWFPDICNSVSCPPSSSFYPQSECPDILGATNFLLKFKLLLSRRHLGLSTTYFLLMWSAFTWKSVSFILKLNIYLTGKFPPVTTGHCVPHNPAIILQGAGKI